jgi:hypothetical protein
MTTEPDEWWSDDGEARDIFRRGDVVHRTPQPWTPAVAELLLHLESVGYGAAPRHRGYDDEGREVLTFLPGDDGPVSWVYLHSDEGLASVARLLRSYHDAVRGYRPSPDTEWADGPGAPRDGEILCHGDFAPWNLVWQERRAVGIFDWDFVRPAEPMFDVYYAMDWTVPFRDDETCLDFHHFESVPDRAHRVGVFLDAYGVDAAPADVAAGVADVRRRVAATAASLAERGIEPQAQWVAEGLLEQSEATSRWIEASSVLFQP